MRTAAMSFEELTSDWPPCVIEGRSNVTYPIKWDQAIVNGQVFVDKEFVRFYAAYEGQTFLCSFQTPGEETSVKMAKVLEENKGRTVQSIGTIKVLEA